MLDECPKCGKSQYRCVLACDSCGCVWNPTSESSPTKAETALRQLVNHPLLLDLFGRIEDSGTAEAAKLMGYVKAWVELRDETLADLEREEAANAPR